ncbi:FAD-dependent oxidoreductase [Dietzia psychralcaliphila]|uniref:FAD-dependent oxidoreductase n=2 Tax=Dietzia psychralcaliphila TaxID=139021 RepID=UPI000D315A67|nr:FAD-dependent oxidoreductase [Dietzia psychralcaliphila]PTM90297.1 glycine oxidase [Dietzia psychralcaliphila]
MTEHAATDDGSRPAADGAGVAAGAAAVAAQGAADAGIARIGARRVAVVGGSVIGLACAWSIARTHLAREVVVYEPDDSGPDGVPASAAAWVAGGMLAPFSEAWPGEEAVFALGVDSLRRWPEFLRALEPYVPPGPPVRTATHTHMLAVDEADARDLDMAINWAARQPDPTRDAVGPGSGSHPGATTAITGADLRRVTRRELREAEPSLARVARAVYRMDSEGAVDNRVLLAALTRACRAEGVTWERNAVTSLDDVDADRVVLAAGAGSAELAGLPVRPVKGEVLRLRARPGCEDPPRGVVRAFVRGRPVYLVPREGGLVVGATQYEHGDDRQVTVAGVRDLLADAETIFPGVGEYELTEAIAGLRPMSPDNLPFLGVDATDPRLIHATGHGRNGIALTPVTVAAVWAELHSVPVPAAARAAAPDRFSRG